MDRKYTIAVIAIVAVVVIAATVIISQSGSKGNENGLTSDQGYTMKDSVSIGDFHVFYCSENDGFEIDYFVMEQAFPNQPIYKVQSRGIERTMSYDMIRQVVMTSPEELSKNADEVIDQGISSLDTIFGTVDCHIYIAKQNFGASGYVSSTYYLSEQGVIFKTDVDDVVEGEEYSITLTNTNMVVCV